MLVDAVFLQISIVADFHDGDLPFFWSMLELVKGYFVCESNFQNLVFA